MKHERRWPWPPAPAAQADDQLRPASVPPVYETQTIFKIDNFDKAKNAIKEFEAWFSGFHCAMTGSVPDEKQWTALIGRLTFLFEAVKDEIKSQTK